MNEIKVVGAGNLNADLVFIGTTSVLDLEKPFTGRSGKLLDNIIKAMGYSSDEVYLCSLYKPSVSEIEICLSTLESQFNQIKPQVIVALGSSITKVLLGSEVSLEECRGQWDCWKTIPVMPTFEPEDCLNQSGLKDLVWQDLKLVLRFLGKTL